MLYQEERIAYFLKHSYNRSDRMNETAFVYVTYMASTPENVWAALTSGEQSRQYWFGFRIESA